MISAEQAVRLRAVPIRFEGARGPGRRVVAVMVDVDDEASADELSIVTGYPVRVEGIDPASFEELVRRAFGATAAAMAARLGGGAGGGVDDDLVANLQAVDADDVRRMAEQPTVINLVNLIILEAVRDRASDVHLEPFDGRFVVKYRIDGMLRERNSPPKRLQPAITSRVKIMAGMNIAERYVPQDGHITLRFEGRKVDVRVSTVPTIYGESIVMRILDKQSITLDLESLGMASRDRAVMDRLIGLPHGMVLVTGPTGSGKTTTLYAGLSKLYDPGKKIITIEDPVEYELDGINQIPVNPDRGLTFAKGLRAILRQDPDVVMVGEIRDGETADIAVRAALTGHLIFSTLHTNDAASAVGRLIDMGVEPFLLSSVLEGVLAQRLGRRVCAVCRGLVPMSEAVRHRLSDAEASMFPSGSGRTMCTRGAGCERCDGTGFRGRLGFYELLTVSHRMRETITKRMTSRHELLAVAPANHVLMRADGLMKAAEGMTTPEEVLRATQDVGDVPVGEGGGGGGDASAEVSAGG